LEKFRRSIIKTEDIKNGYLNLEGYSEGWGEVAIFKKKNGTYIVGVADSTCGPECEGTLKFLTYQDGNWTDVTDEVFPMPGEEEVKSAFKSANLEEENFYFFVLPRIGRTVKMSCGFHFDNEDTVLMEFVWNGEQFEARKKQGEVTSTNPNFAKICHVTNAGGADFYVDSRGETIQLKKGTLLSSAKNPKVFQGGNIEVKAKVGKEWFAGTINVEDTSCL